jgi:hypothetical protein
MDYEEEDREERGFKEDLDDEDMLEPLEEITDFGLDEEDPDKDH